MIVNASTRGKLILIQIDCGCYETQPIKMRLSITIPTGKPMHHHNKKQGLSRNEKVLFTDKENELLKTGKGSYTLVLKQVIEMGRKPLHKSGNPAYKVEAKATLPPIAN